MYGELGRTPTDILCIKLRIVNFWNRLISNKKKFSCILYKSAHFMSFSIKFTNSFSISKNAFIDEYREFSGRVYTHPNKRSLLNT
jgi:hypothetical protein